MKYTFVVLLAVVALFATCAYGSNDYLWGQIGKNDYILAKDKVSKKFFVGKIGSKKYVFNQKNDLNALTITAIKVTDKMKENGATVQLLSGGPGSKGATLLFKSKRGHGIKDVVEIYGR